MLRSRQVETIAKRGTLRSVIYIQGILPHLMFFFILPFRSYLHNSLIYLVHDGGYLSSYEIVNNPSSKNDIVESGQVVRFWKRTCWGVFY